MQKTIEVAKDTAQNFNLRGRDALLAKLLARVEAHRESGAKVPIVLAGEPGSGKTALLRAMSREWRATEVTVAACSGLAEFSNLASTIEKQGPLTIVLDGVDERSNPGEFARAAIALAQDGHTVVVGCRPSVLKHLPDAVLLLPVGESLRFTESDFVSWIRDEVPTDVARKLDEKRGQKWLMRAFEVSEGLALYASVIVRGLSDGSLQPEGSPPRLDEEWARMLSDAGVLDDSGRLALLLVGICQMPASSWQAQETLAAFIDVDPTVSMPAVFRGRVCYLVRARSVASSRCCILIRPQKQGSRPESQQPFLRTPRVASALVRYLVRRTEASFFLSVYPSRASARCTVEM